MSVSLGNTLKVLILFIHAWSGCDTTSSIYGLGKASIMKKLQKSKHLREICSLFGTDGATQTQICKAGLSLFAVCYGGNAGDSLNHLRYKYVKDRATETATNSESCILPLLTSSLPSKSAEDIR